MAEKRTFEEYTDANIKTLEGVEHIRRRPGMYIGRLGNGSNPGDGIYVLLKEIVDNCIDEFSAGFGNKVLIDIDGKQVRVRDFGRGIPLGSVVKATSELNTGGKFDDKVFKKSVGLNGVGTKAVNALQGGREFMGQLRPRRAQGQRKEGQGQREKRHPCHLHPRQRDVRRLRVQHGLRGDHGEELLVLEKRPYPCT